MSHKQEVKQDKRAAALRENLKKRKARAKTLKDDSKDKGQEEKK